MTVYVIHSLPQFMSVVQLFIGGQMAMVGHLVKSDTLAYEPKLDLATNQQMATPWRGMLLKDNQGDVAVVVARWLGQVQGRPGIKGTPTQKGK